MSLLTRPQTGPAQAAVDATALEDMLGVTAVQRTTIASLRPLTLL